MVNDGQQIVHEPFMTTHHLLTIYRRCTPWLIIISHMNHEIPNFVGAYPLQFPMNSASLTIDSLSVCPPASLGSLRWCRHESWRCGKCHALGGEGRRLATGHGAPGCHVPCGCPRDETDAPGGRSWWLSHGELDGWSDGQWWLMRANDMASYNDDSGSSKNAWQRQMEARVAYAYRWWYIIEPARPVKTSFTATGPHCMYWAL